MATIVKSCDGDCSSSGDACTTDYPVCPVGYYCAFGVGFLEEYRETECLSGRCINVDNPDDVLHTDQYDYYYCNRCDPGYVIVEWKDEHKTKVGKSDCEFVTSSCPQICLPDPVSGDVGSECGDKSECGNCEDLEIPCLDASGMFTFHIECSAERQRVCSSDYSGSGADVEEVDSLRPKGVVAGDTLLKCCGCDFNWCPGCGSPCAGTCGNGAACDDTEICDTSTHVCGICVPLSGPPIGD